MYRESIDAWQPENKGGALGSGKALSIKDNGKTIAVYDGSSAVTVDLDIEVVSKETIQKMIDGTYVEGDYQSGDDPGSGGGGTSEEDDGIIATDDDIQSIIDNLFDGESGGAGGGSGTGSEDTPGDTEDDEVIATEDDIQDIINNLFDED